MEPETAGTVRAAESPGRSPSPADELDKAIEDMMVLLEDPETPEDDRKMALTTMEIYFKISGRAAAFLPALQLFFLTPLVSLGATVLILLAADRTRFYHLALGDPSYAGRYQKLRQLLEELRSVPNSSSGALGRFVSRLETCLEGNGPRIMTANQFKRIIKRGPPADVLPPEQLEGLLKVALERREGGRLHFNRLADASHFWLFTADPASATGPDEAAYIKPFTRDMLLSLGAVQFAFSCGEFGKGQRLLNLVERAVLRVGTFYDFMPASLRISTVASKKVDVLHNLTPHEYAVASMESILGGDVATRLPAVGDVAGEQQLQQVVEEAVRDVAKINAAMAMKQMQDFMAAAFAAGAAGQPLTTISPATLMYPGGGLVAAGSSSSNSAAGAGTSAAAVPQPAAGSSSSSLAAEQPAAGGAAAAGGGMGVAFNAPNPLMHLLSGLPLPASLLADSEDATRAAAQQVMAQMRQQEQISLDMRRATNGVMNTLLRLALQPAAAQGGDGEAAGPEPMEVEGQA